MIVQVKSLKKRYKKDWVLKGIDITIEEPQIIALVGPNGSGKTTLLNCMTNLLSFNEGSVEILGKANTAPSLFYEISYLQDNRILYGNLTAYDHLKFICRVQKLPFSRIQEVAERVGMTSYLKRRVRNFSLGMKQHLLLAMVILNKPKLLLMDEPLNGLDPTSAINMRNILLELYKEGTTIIISSHNLDEIDRLTNTIYFMKDGALLKESLKELTVIHYELTVSDTEKAKGILEEEGLPFTSNDQGQLGFKETDVPLQTIIGLLYGNGIEINHIDNQKAGAEKRYRELFEERATV
ncbi:ABC transporter ATP-binding protein [Sporosarcina thermotolerans]|uniref:ABC transporter ATP-binding protein n=1 Tax=Sporosarcina thermotolerans TaxID=633404 RepID=A0AAW9AB08_9BACL|nr:ABC transporter ATP-binding protein [Sporosarcina thermotolerans]MDW0118224.1 ABC transporter ATP-binding protein [Sporosarcina thermotolerans]WHT48535.1 ABC transporter ATP-binding protein [Sporosarcina thermotolerans]